MSDMLDVAARFVIAATQEGDKQLAAEHVPGEWRLSYSMRMAEIAAQVAQAEALEQIAESAAALERYAKQQMGEASHG